MLNNVLFCILRSAKQKILLMYSWYNFSSKPNATKASMVRGFLKEIGTFLNIPGPETNKKCLIIKWAI